MKYYNLDINSMNLDLRKSFEIFVDYKLMICKPINNMRKHKKLLLLNY